MNVSNWIMGGLLGVMLGSAVFSALTYQVAVENQLAIAAIEGRMIIKTEDRYTATTAQADLEAIRQLIELNRQELGTAVKTRNEIFEKVFKRLDALEHKVVEKKQP